MTEKEVQKFITYRLVEAREAGCLTQDQLSKLSGFSQSKISKIENGAREIEAPVLYMLAMSLNKPIGFFFPQAKKLLDEE